MTVLTLRQKINGAILITFIVISLIFVSIQLLLQNYHNETVSKEIGALLQMVVEREHDSIANEIYQGLDRALALRLDHIREKGNLFLISVFDESGHLLVSRGNTPETGPLSQEEMETLSASGRIFNGQYQDRYSMVYMQRMEIIGETVGFIRIYYSLEDMKHEQRESVLVLGALLGAILVVMLILLNLIMSRTIVKPILSLKESMDRIEAGKFEAHVYPYRKDEIGILSNTFNKMAQDLATSYQEIELKRSQLLNTLKALRESQEKYRLVVENANDGILIIQEGFIKFANHQAEALSGYSADELGSRHFINFVSAEDKELLIKNYSDRIQGKPAPSSYNFRIIYKSGKLIWVNTSSVLITWENQPATLNFIRDITDLKKAEAQLLHSQKMDAIGTLAGGIAHDFNNLLQVIQGYTQLLLSKKKDQKNIGRELEAILKAAKKGGELTMQLLTFGRKVESHPKTVDINVQIEKTKKMLSRTIPKMIEIKLQLAKDLPAVHVDPGQIEQVMMNLVINARDAMPEGGRILIETESVTLDEEGSKSHQVQKPGEYVRMSVSDTGQGIPKNVMDHIFDPFFTTKKMGDGTGLGLAIVYGIVKNHGGSIHCYSVPDEGTTFKVYFPSMAPSKKRPSKIAPIDSAPVEGGTETVLLVDDEETLRDIGRQLLENYGYTVIAAATAEEALEIYATQGDYIHLVILDLVMPGMGGKKCIDALLELNPEVKIVVATGYFATNGKVFGGDEALAKTKGFIKKPFVLESMLQEIRRALEDSAN